ncbi:down syndrome cell adhesion molecule-like protein Dscam2 [Caerostris darwini]|uniref:Down syndrome cell adhesion molecule-like protein Dscam2 n=1 Tax=Caerostris darwini TaxID=1538125 RepID=A0AAV4X3L5_9ARAC|nr:down syndrome cell adhesion molecule-like protein Dscam2 [Caerostris darwini]
MVRKISNPKGLCELKRKDQRGPVFRTEPSSRIEFSNSSGTELRCAADGVPSPRLSWQTREGGKAQDVPGLRYTNSDGTLVFPPFARNDYRQDVHDTVYQCLASNSVGSIASRDVHVRGDTNNTHFVLTPFNTFSVLDKWRLGGYLTNYGKRLRKRLSEEAFY